MYTLKSAALSNGVSEQESLKAFPQLERRVGSYSTRKKHSYNLRYIIIRPIGKAPRLIRP